MWIDEDMYCWYWSTLQSINCERNNSVMDATLGQKLFRADIRLLQKSGNKMKPNVMNMYVMYILVDGYYPKWSIFIEPDCADK